MNSLEIIVETLEDALATEKKGRHPDGFKSALPMQWHHTLHSDSNHNY